jgi:tripartite-type tricarboxylate transporter receptor subunit TctC
MTRTILAAGVAIALAAPAAAADFYDGKQIKLVVSTEPGGAYDVYARLIAQYWGKYIPGHPAFVVQNMPGASGLKTANFIYNQAPRDGTVIAATHSGVPTTPLLSPAEAQFDLRKLSWIGSATKDPFVGFVWHTAPVKTFEAAKTTEVIMGGDGVGSAGVDMAIVSNVFFGTKFKIVTGYTGGPQVKLAMERGEVHGTFANAWTALKLAQPDWLKDGKITIITQHGFTRHAELPDVPLFMDQAKKPEDRQALELLLARQEFAKPYFGPPEVPADRVLLLRRGFDAVLKDPELLAGAAKASLPIDGPMTGEELATLTARLAETPPSVVQRIEKVFTDFKAAGK